MRSLSLKGQKISYEVRRSRRAKHVSLTAQNNGSFVLTLPRGVSEEVGKRFIYEKINWILRTMQFFRRYGIPKAAAVRKRDARLSYLQYRERARALVVRRLSHFNRYYGLLVNRVAIKNQKTQWGSCSLRRNLNFNYRVYFLPVHLADYVIVHELCHLRHFNHSSSFWNLIGEAIPDYKEHEAELRRYLLL